MFSLQGKTVVVTGGGKGIGKGISLAMASQGANVVVSGRSPDALHDTVRQITDQGGTAIAVPADMMGFDGINTLVQTALDHYGYIDCWVNNAGSASPDDVGPAIDITEQQWDAVVDLNLKWSFFAAQAAARTMTRGGSILNISSRSGSQPCPMTSQYGAAKAGIENLTATLAVEWGHLNIRVNAIAPGVVITEASAGLMTESRRKRQIETVPLHRLGQVEDVAPLAVYFAADESSWVTGSVVQVTGGSRIPVGVLTYLHKKHKELEEQESGG